MTTTGHTAIDSALAKGSASLGGHENISKELMDMEVRFGELIHNHEYERRHSPMAESQSDEPSDGAGAEEERASVNGRDIDDVYSVRRAGFGTVQDISPLRRRAIKRSAWP
jgi:hypothetical protein